MSPDARRSRRPHDRARVRALYDGVVPLAERSHFMNLGYWKDDPETLDDAAAALVRLVGDKAEFAGKDEVLDVGFGFADQDLIWARSATSPRRIVGLDLAAANVRRARTRVRRSGLDAQIELRVGSATDMPLRSRCFDKVVAVESALHFATREDFFAEAYRVLRPGGRLVVADILPLGTREDPLVAFSDFALTQAWRIPAENLYGRSTYVRKLKTAGFSDVRTTSIRRHVFEPFREHLSQQVQSFEFARRQGLTGYLFYAAILLPIWPLDFYDYVIAVAHKPRGRRRSPRGRADA